MPKEQLMQILPKAQLSRGFTEGHGIPSISGATDELEPEKMQPSFDSSRLELEGRVGKVGKVTQPNQACQQESNCTAAAESIRESGCFTSSGTFSNRGSSCYTKLPPSGQPVLLLSSSTASESTANSGSSTLLRYYNSIEQASIASLPPESLKMLPDMN